MFNMKKVEIEWGGKTLTLETGRVARQADGAVLATYGETVVLCAVTAARSVKEGQDFFPLTVHYQEKFSAAGRIPGGFFKRERGATEKETLTSRLIDRPIRPLFPEGFYNEINVIAQVLSYDGETESDILAMIAASAALTISGVPFMGPIAAARIGYADGEYLLNPSMDEVREGELDLVVAGTHNAVMMVESEAKELSEEVMLGAVMFAHAECKKVIEAIIKLAEKAAKDPWEMAEQADLSAAKTKLKKLIGKDIAAAYKLTDKSARSNALNDARAKAKAAFADAAPQDQMAANKLVKKLEAEIVRTAILKDGQRIDGRTTSQIRPIEAIVGFLPRTHGSALFTRGETQAICTTTLGTKDTEQMIDGLTGLSYERFMLHYNFPPYSVGEVGRFGAPGRREVGHGKLAWRALHPVLPSHGGLPLHDPRPLRHHRVQRLVVDGDGVRRKPRDDGRGRAAEAAGLGHRHGPDPRRQGFRRAQRHPRRRGPSGRHGLQGRRHLRRHHLAADGHQDRRHHRGDHEGRARPGEGRPRPHPGRDGQGARPHPRGAVGSRAADRDDADRQGEDPRRHRHRRQGDPRDRRRRPAPRSTSTTRA